MGDELGDRAVQGHSGVDGLVVVADVESWLLDSDPALRWQVERDVSGDSPSVWEATRARVAKEGFGARLLALQDPDGRWAGGAFFPAGFDFADVDEEGQPWTATTWVLNDLREWGVAPAVLRERGTRGGWRTMLAGNTTTCRTGVEKCSAASTPGRSPTASGWE